MPETLESGPVKTYLHWISHLELYFGNSSAPWEEEFATAMIRELAKEPNQLKTLSLELWDGLGTQWQEIVLLTRLEQVKVSQRFTLIIWFTKVRSFEFGYLDARCAYPMSDGGYAIESVSVEIDHQYYNSNSRWTRKQWVMVPKAV